MTATTDPLGLPQRAGGTGQASEAGRIGGAGDFGAALEALRGGAPDLAAVQAASVHIQTPLSILTSVPGGTAHRVVATQAYGRDWK